MQSNDDPTIAEIRETRHRISEAFGHDPQRIIEYHRQLQTKEDELRHKQKQVAEEQKSELIKA